jgi:hypothetical protein
LAQFLFVPIAARLPGIVADTEPALPPNQQHASHYTSESGHPAVEPALAVL